MWKFALMLKVTKSWQDHYRGNAAMEHFLWPRWNHEPQVSPCSITGNKEKNKQMFKYWQEAIKLTNYAISSCLKMLWHTGQCLFSSHLPTLWYDAFPPKLTSWYCNTWFFFRLMNKHHPKVCYLKNGIDILVS